MPASVHAAFAWAPPQNFVRPRPIRPTGVGLTEVPCQRQAKRPRNAPRGRLRVKKCQKRLLRRSDRNIVVWCGVWRNALAVVLWISAPCYPSYGRQKRHEGSDHSRTGDRRRPLMGSAGSAAVVEYAWAHQEDYSAPQSRRRHCDALAYDHPSDGRAKQLRSQIISAATPAATPKCAAICPRSG